MQSYFISFFIKWHEAIAFGARETSVCMSYRSLGNHFITMVVPRFWNSLPTHIKNARTVDFFIALLKTHLFKLAFPNYIVIHDIVFIDAYFCHFLFIFIFV